MKEPLPITNASRLLNAGCLVLVTAAAKGRVNIMPASWAMPASMRPPLVAISLANSSFTHELITRSNEFVLNIPSVELAKPVQALGLISGRNVDKFQRTGLHPAPPKVVAAPLIEECLAALECAVANTVTVGDHTLFIGEVLVAWAEKDAFDEVWKLEHRELKPLHHLGATFFSTLEPPFQVQG